MPLLLVLFIFQIFSKRVFWNRAAGERPITIDADGVHRYKRGNAVVGWNDESLRQIAGIHERSTFSDVTVRKSLLQLRPGNRAANTVFEHDRDFAYRENASFGKNLRREAA